MPILPPPPSIELALWAALHALWFRLARALARLRAVPAAPRSAPPAPNDPARPTLGTPPWQRVTERIGRPALITLRSHPRPLPEDRPTTVERRRS